MRIVVVGGGMQGRVIAENLLRREEKPEVVVADVREPHSLPAGVKFLQTDVLNAQQAASLMNGADAAVLAVPSQISRDALKNLIATGAAVSDVSFTPDPPLDLNEEAKKTGSCCVVDCGVAPGTSHILVGAAHAELGGLDRVRIYVGGMPQTPPPVFNHAVYFNPHDLLAEYVRPARARKAGKDIDPAPLDAPIEKYYDEELGELDAFLSDGLRSLLGSFQDVPDMAELTLRWKGHLDTMKNLRELGLLEDEAIRAVGNTMGVRYPENQYPDVLLMIVYASRGKEHRVWRLIDRRTNDESAMSRTTGYTTAAVAMMLARKQFTTPGVHAPEKLGADPKLVETLIRDLNERGVSVTSVAKNKLLQHDGDSVGVR